MVKIAHIISPFVSAAYSDLHIAQHFFFETIIRSKEFSSRYGEVEIFAAVYPDAIDLVPNEFRLTPVLERSILDLRPFETKKKLPILRDILDRVILISDADYILYTNVDILLQPFFYGLVISLINSGYDGFIINRRTISKEFITVDQLPLMMAHLGETHKGYDCFIFKRSVYQHFFLADVCLGINLVGKVLAWNIALNTNSFYIFKDLHATFHLGNDKTWLDPGLNEYSQFNLSQAHLVLNYFNEVKPDAIEILKANDILKPYSLFNEYY